MFCVVPPTYSGEDVKFIQKTLLVIVGFVTVDVGSYAIGTVGKIGTAQHAAHVAVFVGGWELVIIGVWAVLVAVKEYLP